MKRIFVPVLALFAFAARGDGNVHRFHATLVGINEVPPVFTAGHADVSLKIADDDSSIDFTITYENLSANPAAAHVHFGPPRVNGGVSIFLCGGGAQPACPASTSGTITGTATAANVVGPVAQGIAAGNLAAIIQMMRAGVTYANMHTANFPGGEIRGQVRPGLRGFFDHGRD